MPDPAICKKKLITPVKLRVESEEHLPPDPGGTALLVSRLGYTLSQALADIVDNAIDADAKTVLIRFIRTDGEIKRIEIINDGKGIETAGASEVMRLGLSTGKGPKSLGKYGTGLKSASLSQANSLTVLSLSNNNAVGRKWTLENIKQDWLCQKLKESDVKSHFSEIDGPVVLNGNGTMIIWEDLHHLITNKKTIERDLGKAIRSIRTDLGLWFHRFIETEKLKILIDVQVAGHEESGAYELVAPLNPFSYSKSGREGYPRRFKASLPGNGDLELEAHIWPSKSKEHGYTLGGGKVASRQGFYFYRNDRLIQAGGWNGCRDDDTEPHLSLARVVIDLPDKLDGSFKFEVTKTKMSPPPQFAAQVIAATAIDGTTFNKFLQDAQATYRTQVKKDAGTFKYKPSYGFPTNARNAASEILHQKGAKKLEGITFTWKKLSASTFVDLDRENGELVLNSRYRKKVLNGQPASATDAPLIKLLMFFLFHDELERKASSEKYQDWLDRLNLALVATCDGIG